jgi:hypothetical protein
MNKVQIILSKKKNKHILYQENAGYNSKSSVENKYKKLADSVCFTKKKVSYMIVFNFFEFV